jgi:hypothetical protein
MDVLRQEIFIDLAWEQQKIFLKVMRLTLGFGYYLAAIKKDKNVLFQMR